MVVVSCLGIDFHSINPLQLMPFPSKPTPSIISIFKISWPHLSTTHSFLNHQSHIASLHPWFELHSHFSSHQFILSCQFAKLPIDALSSYFFVYASWRLVINELSKPQCLWQKNGFRMHLASNIHFIHLKPTHGHAGNNAYVWAKGHTKAHWGNRTCGKLRNNHGLNSVWPVSW